MTSQTQNTSSPFQGTGLGSSFVTVAVGMPRVCPRSSVNLQPLCRRSPEIVTRLLSLAWLWAVGTLRASPWLQWGSGQEQCMVRHLERHRKLVCLGRVLHFSGCRSAAHEGVRSSLSRFAETEPRPSSKCQQSQAGPLRHRANSIRAFGRALRCTAASFSLDVVLKRH
jgi:hypothetical protein